MVEADRSEICELARLAHEGTVFADMQFSTKKFSTRFDDTINKPEHYLGLAVKSSGKSVRFCCASLGGYYIGDNANVVTVNVIATERKVRSTMLGGRAVIMLQRGIEEWARTHNAKFVLYHVTSGMNASNLDRFFRKSGLKTLGGNYGYAI
ncbi:hypothetical protein [Litoreibacter roseus]|uniref:N-acetyltransferase domain-containing protein n=1 Tax=Litoreibacter roseus TaxID=2601869 RepID=A0A6N6JCK0_9RHOB|nr:hypothetical protein [Litoreibacter roseus]GFE63139.1 hypothetical protein KIN_02130 [Litoreibacter roseus]